MNVSDRRILCARIRRHHHVTVLFRLYELLRDVALDDFVREVAPHRVATEAVNLKALLQCETAGFKTNVHQSSAGKIGISENRFHPRSSRILLRHPESRNVKEFASKQTLDTLAVMARSPRVEWTREHELIALNLYGKLPFGQFHHNNPIIMDVASRMGRSPGSLAMKLSNLASLDPVQTARGIKGLRGASQLDRDMWKEFHREIESLGPESEQLLHDLFTKNDDQEVDFLEGKIQIERARKPPSGPTEIKASVRVRRGQQFFRQTVLNSYGVKCCISGINIPRLLVASHIKPWRDFPSIRLDPRNGLCLSALHDAAFDSGLITLDESLGVTLSPKLKGFLPSKSLNQNFVRFEGKPIRLPEKIAEPSLAFLDYHRKKIFQR